MPGQRPAISVILPTYNREPFLADAFDSIARQICTDWELIVVDDGSTDGTRAAVDRLTANFTQPVTYVHQENRGAYGARNTGLDHARGEHIAFFDSDDLWFPHHLSRGLDAFERHPSLDWVYGAVRRVEHASGRVLDESSFYVDGRRRPFLDLAAHEANGLRIVDDANAVACQLVHGFYCGLQNSVIHRRLFEGRRFVERFKVVEDELFFIRALTAGAKVAYYMEPHVLYRVHGLNSSASAKGSDEKALAIFRELVDGFEDLRANVPFSASQRRALHTRLSSEYFWHLGYHGLWRTGRRQEALAAFRRGMSFRPFDVRLWKSYAGALARTYLQPPQGARS